MLGSAYSSPRIEGDHMGGGTRVPKQMASTASGLHMAAAPLFLWEQDALEKKGARPLVETASIASGLRIASVALFLSKEKRKSSLNHSFLF